MPHRRQAKHSPIKGEVRRGYVIYLNLTRVGQCPPTIGSQKTHTKRFNDANC
jgi:hypothetical protein